MKRRTKIGIAVTAVVVIGGLAAMIAATRDKGAVAANVQPVERRDLVAYVNASGWIRPHRRVDVQADIMGRIVELNVREGQNVSRDQVLLRIDPTQYQAAVSRARASVSEALAREAQARANLLQAERQAERFRQLAAANANLVSGQQLEEAATQVEVQRELLNAAAFGVQQARSALEEATDRLAKTVIRAPMDGVVTRLNVEEGETAIVGTMNNAGSLLLTVADLGAMEAVVRVDETDLPELHLGDSASLQIDAFPKRTFTGRVTEIGHSAIRSPEQQAQQGTGGQGQAIDYEIVVTLDDPPETLRSDLSVTAEIVTAKRQQALSIPIIALTVRERGQTKPIPQESEAAQRVAELAADGRGEDQEGVFVVREGKAEFVTVEVGIAGKDHFEVLSGLTEKDSVVAGPYDVIRTLEAGKAVRNTNAARAGGRTSIRAEVAE
ncbi:MAG TPA: efflux RND transporter periplasmic adaptor subunit [Longimicrobiales bacterium]|nr:efflux RND transporter periplasmic adaptor subunit [Longimicrobiales bacterium]